MAILNKITVGNKLVLEVNANPISAGANAPIGSQALWKDDTDPLFPVGRSYLKIGPADTDWTAYQVGQDTAGWYFADSVSALNETSVARYLGTKSGNFDIVFVRNSVEMIRLANNLIKLKNYIVFDGVDGEIASTGTFLNLKAPVVRIVASVNTEIDSESNALERKYMKSNADTLANGLNQPRPSADSVPTESIMEVITTVVDKADSSKFAQWVKTYRVYKANGVGGAVTVELLQDDLTKASQNMGNIRVSHAIALAQITTSFTNIPDANSYQISTFVKELIAKL